MLWLKFKVFLSADAFLIVQTQVTVAVKLHKAVFNTYTTAWTGKLPGLCDALKIPKG